eukprot:30275-Prymnesium_polylepis.1
MQDFLAATLESEAALLQRAQRAEAAMAEIHQQLLDANNTLQRNDELFAQAVKAIHTQPAGTLGAGTLGPGGRCTGVDSSRGPILHPSPL